MTKPLRFSYPPEVSLRPRHEISWCGCLPPAGGFSEKIEAELARTFYFAAGLAVNVGANSCSPDDFLLASCGSPARSRRRPARTGLF